jgi:hypothetical protein
MEDRKPLYIYTINIKPDYVYSYSMSMQSVQDAVVEEALKSLNGNYPEATSVLKQFTLSKS